MALDQAHEQHNDDINSDGGAAGLTQSPEALRRWMDAGPELVRVTSEFETSLERKHNKPLDTSHHEQTKSFQITFGKQVKELVDVMEEMGNPFLEETTDLLRLDTRDIVDPTVTASVRQAETMGQEQYQTFMTDPLVEQTTPIREPIKNNKLSLFSRPSQREKSNTSVQVSSLKIDCFFKHENQACPPCFSQLGKLSSETKSDILACLKSNCAAARGEAPGADVTILDGAVVVNFLKKCRQDV